MKIRKMLMALAIAMLGLTACNSSSNENTSSSNDTVDNVSVESVESTDTSAKTENNIVRLTTTTSVNDSGLMDYLKDAFTEDTGLEMEIVSKGTGAAIEDAKAGNADVILVHAPSKEEEFVKEGYGIERTSFMHNYFVIVGPKDDPAGIKSKDAIEALKLINESGSKFVSRGDESGTHTKEKALWQEAGVDLDSLENSDNYLSVGDGMGATLTFASENQAYSLTDLSTFLSMKNDLDLDVLVDKSESLKNIYSIIVVNPEKVSGTNVENAKKFEEWMTSDRASELIAEYGKDEYGQALFILGE